MVRWPVGHVCRTSPGGNADMNSRGQLVPLHDPSLPATAISASPPVDSEGLRYRRIAEDPDEPPGREPVGVTRYTSDSLADTARPLDVRQAVGRTGVCRDSVVTEYIGVHYNRRRVLTVLQN